MIDYTWLQTPIRDPRGHDKDPGTIGIEIEVEGRNLPKDLFHFWAVHDDGSLRGHDNCEYVLREPMKRQELDKALTYLEAKFQAARSELDAESDRTSVHIHLNFQKKTWIEVFIFWTFWTILEDLSFELCGTERRGNLFCLRVKDCEALVVTTKRYLEVGSLPFSDNNARYAGCNLNALNKFGSIEFRGMHGTVDKEEILIWIDFLRACANTATEFDSPQEVIQRFSQLGPRGFINLLRLPPQIEGRLMAPQNANQMLWEGMRLAQDIAFLIPVWPEKKAPKKSKKTENEVPEIVRRRRGHPGDAFVFDGVVYRFNGLGNWVREDEIEPAPQPRPEFPQPRPELRTALQVAIDAEQALRANPPGRWWVEAPRGPAAVVDDIVQAHAQAVPNQVRPRRRRPGQFVVRERE